MGRFCLVLMIVKICILVWGRCRTKDGSELDWWMSFAFGLWISRFLKLLLVFFLELFEENENKTGIILRWYLFFLILKGFSIKDRDPF